MSRDPLAGNTGEDNGPREPVHETTMDSRPGEEETDVIDLEWMQEAYALTRKDGATGIDGVTAEQYEANLEANLSDLLERIKSGRYQAPPGAANLHPESGWHATAARHSDLRRQGGAAGVTMVLEAVYEQDFRSCSYGFRPERSAHQALRTLHSATTRHGQYWVLDIDVRKILAQRMFD